MNAQDAAKYDELKVAVLHAQSLLSRPEHPDDFDDPKYAAWRVLERAMGNHAKSY